MTLRELLIKIGFDVDENKIKRVNDSIAQTKKTAESTVGAIADVARRTADIGRGLTMAVTLPIVGIGVAAAKASGTMEQFTVQWSVLLGSQEKAMARMRELKDFAQTTPFELPEVVQASKVLENLTKGALSTGAGLRMVGDVASGTGQDFNSIAIYAGRAFSGLKSNRAIGEALERFQEIGAITGEARNKIEELQKAGKGKEAWRVLEGEFSRYAGMMDAEAKTLFGLLSNLKDAVNEALRELGDQFIEDLKGVIKELINMSAKLVEVVKWFFNLPAPVKNVILALVGIVAIAGPVLWALGSFAKAVLSIITTLGMLKNFLPIVVGAVRTAMTAISKSLATNPVGWIILAIGLFIMLVMVLWKYRVAIGNFFKTLGDSFMANFAPVLDFLYKIIKGFAFISSLGAINLPDVNFKEMGAKSRDRMDQTAYKWGDYSRAKGEKKVYDWAEMQKQQGGSKDINLNVNSKLEVPEGTTAQQKKYLEDFANQTIDKRMRAQLDLAMAGSGATK